MSSIDQFESVFRSAMSDTYEPRPFPIREVTVISSLEPELEARHLAAVERLFEGSDQPSPKITAFPKENSREIPRMVEELNKLNPDLIITYRDLHEHGSDYAYSLGDHVEVLTQMVSTPILLLPDPSHWSLDRIKPPSRVMVLTDHLIEHPQLIDAALTLLSDPGELTLAHVEDDATFERYMGHISKIPEIDTDVARALLQKQILGSAERFIETTTAALGQRERSITVQGEVKMGHRLKSYVELVKDHEIELIVMQTKDDDQVAMHGLSYPLAVELRDTPLLML